jgi:hypothetical protein
MDLKERTAIVYGASGAVDGALARALHGMTATMANATGGAQID